MISLNQIQLLEQKVESVLQLVSQLQNEKSDLENQNADLKMQLQKITAKYEHFEQDGAKIEQGILSVLNRLNDMEDAVQLVLDKEPSPTSNIKTANTPEDAAIPSDTGAAKQTEISDQYEAEKPPLKPVGEQLDIF
ncbi:hypothetical protein H0R92_07265 [Treponema sp. OMZ 840]|uniref:cell division protein ZapB n=1 Tax=Treponema sp. OMZ 840 TaxID=244313 RepID=UPI003D89E1AB